MNSEKQREYRRQRQKNTSKIKREKTELYLTGSQTLSTSACNTLIGCCASCEEWEKNNSFLPLLFSGSQRRKKGTQINAYTDDNKTFNTTYKTHNAEKMPRYLFCAMGNMKYDKVACILMLSFFFNFKIFFCCCCRLLWASLAFLVWQSYINIIYSTFRARISLQLFSCIFFTSFHFYFLFISSSLRIKFLPFLFRSSTKTHVTMALECLYVLLCEWKMVKPSNRYRRRKNKLNFACLMTDFAHDCVRAERRDEINAQQYDNHIIFMLIFVLFV